MELYTKLLAPESLLTIFTKSPILDFWQGSGYAFALNQNKKKLVSNSTKYIPVKNTAFSTTIIFSFSTNPGKRKGI